MPRIALLRQGTNDLVNTIVAEMTDYCPEGLYFVEIPDGFEWRNGKLVDARTPHYVKQPQAF
jgi:hypothetical protein